MSGKFFIDTNVFVYCFDERWPEKQERANALVSHALQSGNGVISWQVIQEFLNVSTRKFVTRLEPGDAKQYLDKVLHPLCHVFPDLDLYRKALEVSGETDYSFYDALIIVSALQGGCSILYTEDLHSGHIIEKIEVVNPFKQ